MKRIGIQRPRARRERDWGEALLPGPRDPDVVRAKALARPIRSDRPAEGTARKDLIKYGTSRLDDTLVRDHLIDEFRFWIRPVVAGCGRRLSEDVDTCGLDLGLTGKRRLD